MMQQGLRESVEDVLIDEYQFFETVSHNPGVVPALLMNPDEDENPNMDSWEAYLEYMEMSGGKR